MRKWVFNKINSDKKFIETIINFYLKPNTLMDTCRFFNLNNDEVKKILVDNNISFHNKEIVNKLINEKKKKNSLIKYGVESPNQLKDVKEKKKKTYQERYGVDSSVQLDKAVINRNKSLQENKERIKERRQNTFLNKYGVKEAISSKQVRDKIKQTNLKRYGVENTFQSYDIQEKCRNKLLEKYGVEHPAQSIEIQEKIKQTNLKRYNKEYYTQTKEYKEKILSSKNRKINKLRDYFRSKYGVEWITQTADFIDKCLETKRKNNTFNTSKPELYVKKLLEDTFGVNDVYYQYRDERYPFECDFYIKSKDLFIECNFHWTHMFHPFNKNNIEDINKLNELKEKAINSEFYKNAINTWTVRDVEKFKIAWDNHLNYIALYSEKDLEDFLHNYD